jgi:hypothetical protein
MPTQSHATTAAPFHRRSHGMHEAMKAGIGATACSVLILAIVCWRCTRCRPVSDNNPDATQIGMALVIALVFASSPVALAHDTAWPRAVTPTGATVVDQQTDGFDVSRTAWPAPVGHRQPRAEDIPAEGPKNAILICNRTAGQDA